MSFIAAGTRWNGFQVWLGSTGTFYPDINQTNVITAIAVAPNNHNRTYMVTTTDRSG